MKNRLIIIALTVLIMLFSSIFLIVGVSYWIFKGKIYPPFERLANWMYDLDCENGN